MYKISIEEKETDSNNVEANLRVGGCKIMKKKHKSLIITTSI